jgi:hypothetical protein
MNMTASELFHSVGHEMIHALHYVSGKFYEWKKEHNDSKEMAICISERLAYQWNLRNLPLISFPGALEYFYEGWIKYVRLYMDMET